MNLYCVDLFAQAFERYGRAVDVTFGNYGVNFGAKRPSLRIDIQHEHTLVKPGGRDSAGAPLGTIPLPDGSGNYLVRLAGYAYLKTLDTVIEYSRPNLVNLARLRILRPLSLARGACRPTALRCAARVR